MATLRKHLSTFVVAAVTAGVTALALGGGPAGAHLTDSFAHLKKHIDRLSMDNVVQYTQGPNVAVASGEVGRGVARCPKGWRVVGGGGFSGDVGVTVDQYPTTWETGSFGTRAWVWRFRNESGSEIFIQTVAICVKADRVIDSIS
jgi:hypothetical protein